MIKNALLATAVVFAASMASAQTNVANISELRAAATGSDFIITGTVIVAQVKNAVQPSRNQFLIVDGSGTDGKTGILVDDSTPNFATTVAVGDTITNFRGALAVFGQGLQFAPLATGTPTVNAGAAIGDPLLNPTVIAGTEAWADIEGEVIRINGADVAETGNWTASTTYALTAGPTSVITAIRFQGSSTSELAGDAIPAGTFDLIGEARRFNSDFQILPRFDSDLIPASNVSDWALYY